MIITYNKYLTFVCKDLEKLPLFESKGISDTIKIFTNIIYDKLQKNITEYTIDIDENDIKLKNLKITLKNSNDSPYYGRSSFDDFKDNYLINSEIFIRFDFNMWNEIEIKRILTHELIHIYEIYKRVNRSIDDVGLQWLLIKKIQEIKTKYDNDDFISDLCLMIYYTSDHEINSIVAQIYPILYSLDSSDKNILNNELLKTKSYKIFLNIKNFDYKNYDIDYDKLIEFFVELNSTMKNLSNKNFTLFNIPNNIKSCNDILKKYQILFLKKSKHLESKLNGIINEIINDIKQQNNIK